MISLATALIGCTELLTLDPALQRVAHRTQE
jgi:hypothetical protein